MCWTISDGARATTIHFWLQEVELLYRVSGRPKPVTELVISNT
jgi:hypothetical protein